MSEYTQILVDKTDGIATITLNRPKKMNAYTRTMGQEIMAAMDDIDADDDVRAVIFTGSADRAFCAGADLTPEGGGQIFSDGAQVESLSDERVRAATVWVWASVQRCNLRGISVWLRTPRAMVSCLRAAALSPRQHQAGSCRASSGLAKRLSGAIRAACSARRRPRLVVSCARFIRRVIL